MQSLILLSVALVILDPGYAQASPQDAADTPAAPAVRVTPAPSQPVAVPQALAAASSRTRRAPTEEESLALAALEGLMSQPPERALPLLKKVLGGSQSTLVKERALFVLSQIDKPEAHTIMLDYAKDTQNPLRGEAIRSIGIGGDKAMLDALKDVYNSGDAATRKNVLQAWLISGNKAAVYAVALAAQSEADASAAIHILSAMGAVDELRKIGEQRKASKSLMEAYAIAGDLPSLRKVADGNGELALRVTAIRHIGIIGTEAAHAALREIYARNDGAELRDAALQGMLIGNDQQGVLTLYRAARTPEEKRKLLRTLSQMGGDAALQAIDAALEAKK